jgi:hypothetical protein
MATVFTGNAQVTVTGADATTNAGSPYTTLKAAFDNINLTSQTGNTIVISITANTTEIATATLNTGTWTSLTISPSGGAARTISGAMTAGTALIDLNGADNVVIDGLNTGSNSLTISNTTVSATVSTSTIRFREDASNNTITRCTVLGSMSAGLGVEGGNISFAAGVTTGNDNNTISYCNLGNGSGLPTRCISIGATGASDTDPGAANSGNIITDNKIYNYFSGTAFSTGINIITGGTSTTISNNKFYQTGSRVISAGGPQSHYAIRIVNTNGNNFQITGNTIGFADSLGTGTYTVTTSQPVSAPHVVNPILLQVDTDIASSIQGNTIAGISFTGNVHGLIGSGPFRGIAVTSGLVNIGNVSANTIGSMSATGSISVTSTTSFASIEIIGIFHNSTSTTNISNNLIGGITGSNTNVAPKAVRIFGIRINATPASNASYANNTIGGNIANSIQSTTTVDSTIVNGILSTNRDATITGNIVRNLTAAGGAGTAQNASVIGILANASSNPNDLNISQNTIFNLSNSNTSAATVVTGICVRSGNATTISANRVYGLSTANTSTGSSASTLIGIQSSIGTHSILNNQISISQSTASTQPKINGIELVTTTANNVQYNSIYIGGTAANTNSSYGILRTTTGAANVQNNLIYNERGGSGTHFAIGYGSAGVWGTLDNNVYITGDAATVGQAEASSNTLAAWQSSTSKDATTLSYTAATYSSATIYTNTSTGDLSPAGDVFPGAYLSTVLTDYAGTTRNTTYPTIGSVEGTTFYGSWKMSAGTNDWATATNWVGDAGPLLTAVIPAGASPMPVISSTQSVTNVLNGGTITMTGANTLNIAGNLRSSGSISMPDGSLVLNGTTAQTATFNADATVANFTLSNAAGATLAGTAKLNVTNAVSFGSVNSATLTAGGVLTLKSTATGTARIADITNAGANSGNAISGNVIVERYIPNTGRKWRFLTAPLSGASNNTVFANWQNNGTVSVGRGVSIWGTAGTCDPGVTVGNGLVPGPGAGAPSSMRKYNSGGNSWDNILNTNTEVLFDAGGNKAFALFVTGHFGGAFTTVAQGSAATTLAATGSLITGSKAFNFTYEDNAEHIALIGNPYASPVNFFNLTRANVNDKFWVWDPNLDGTGGYVLLTGNGSGDYTPSVVSGYSGSAAAGTVYEDIQSGQAIFVEATGAGAASVTFEEADKVSTNHTQVFRNGTQTEKLRVNLLNAANPAAIKVVDGVLVQYSNNFSNAHGAEDGVKLYNDRENLWVDANGKEYMIEGRKLIDNSDTVKLTTWALQQQAYRLEIIGANFANDANLSAFLKDKFLGTETAISLSGTTEYPFTVTSDNNSKATDRFMVVFRSNASLPVTLTNVKAYQQNAGIAVEWNTQSESSMQQYEVEKSANGTNFVKVNTTAAKSGTTNSYNYFDATPFSGANYYRIKAISLNGDVKYSSIVVVRLNTKGTKVTLYPNPVKGDQINLELSGLEKGNYTVSLFNQLGQQVMNRSIQHNGTNATQTINIGTIPSGVYELRLANGTTAVTQKLIKE